MRDPQPRDAAAPKGPAHRPASAPPLSHHNLPFIPHSRQHTAPVRLRARTAWVEGAGFLLARWKMRWRPGDTCLSNASCGLCPRASALSIFLGAWRNPPGIPLSVRARSLTGASPPATMKFRNQTTTTDSTPEVPSGSPAPPSDRRSSY